MGTCGGWARLNEGKGKIKEGQRSCRDDGIMSDVCLVEE